jgi:hypothetical protein
MERQRCALCSPIPGVKLKKWRSSNFPTLMPLFADSVSSSNFAIALKSNRQFFTPTGIVKSIYEMSVALWEGGRLRCSAWFQLKPISPDFAVSLGSLL